MGPKDETSAKAAEIGDGLIESLGFEPADGKTFGRNAVAEVSGQLSDAGFSVTDVLDGTSDDSPKSNGEAKVDSKNGSGPGSGSGSGSGSVRTVDGDSVDSAVDDTVAKADPDAGSGSNGFSGSRSGQSAKSSASSSGGSVSAAATAATAAISAKAGQTDKGASAGTGSAGGNGADRDVLEPVPFTPDAKAPTSPPTADQAPAVTGEIPRVDARVESTPAVAEPRPMLLDNRSIVERPKSVSDLFSGGITGRRRLQARKVRRVIRHIDPWSVLTFSVMFHLCLFAALLLASALVFNVAEEAGTIENLESFIRELGDYETFEIDGQAIFKAAVAIAGILTLAASVLVVLLTVMFNLLSDLLGGVRITVIEEETVRVKPKKSDESEDE
ncbi:MAG: DUF3566 domain-containing protein [Acidimicrobiia bacterium]|nr:DUF3566 domain-containing protein [Acidimicrobiia bacterium]